MKSLYESLLDDFEELGGKQNKAIRAEILKGSWFRLGADSKTIVFEPEAYEGGYDRDVTPGVAWSNYPKNHECVINDISVCKDLGLKFQPLNFITDDVEGKDKDWLKYFDCEYVVNFTMITGQGTTPDIDLSMIKFPIKGSISISGYANKIKSLKPYPHPMEIVRILREPMSSSVINGWKCKHLVITSINNIVFSLIKDRKDNPGVTTEECDQIIMDWVNEILKNNPDVENIYLGQCSNYSDNRRVVTKGKGANRKCIKTVRVPQAKWNTLIHNDSNSELRRMASEVEGWRWQHEDLFECDCAGGPADSGLAATPGNTLGMGNPMAPTGGHNGTEPIIPKHPRNKKKRKSLKESLLDDFDSIERKSVRREDVEEYLQKYYTSRKPFKISSTPNKDGYYEVSTDDKVEVKNTDIPAITNGIFIFTEVGGYFSIRNCKKITTLQGAPKKTGADFICTGCESLKSFDGGPERVQGVIKVDRCGKSFKKNEVDKICKYYWMIQAD